MKRAISKAKFKQLKIGDTIKLANGYVGKIEEIDFESTTPVFVVLDSKKSSISEYSAKLNSGWFEELMIIDIIK
tara:strand:+ start:121 stop:342 length:222 start_codon:yes stop_codon:yes gene_type:complete